MSYTIERIARGRKDTVLFAVLNDEAARHVTIVLWNVNRDEKPQVVVEFDYADHTARNDALWAADKAARHFSRDRNEKALRVLREAGFLPPEAVPDDTGNTNG